MRRKPTPDRVLSLIVTAAREGLDWQEGRINAKRILRRYGMTIAKTKRRNPTRMSDEVADKIRAYAKAHPKRSQKRIADHFGVNHARVSEALGGMASWPGIGHARDARIVDCVIECVTKVRA